MKPVVNVSIGRTAFTLEQGAYDLLRTYLDSLERHFAGNPSGKEIMEEIEVRIAELLLEKCGGAGVVNEKMVREVCDTLGSVGDITADKTADGDGGQSDAPDGDKRKSADSDGGRKERKLYRNPDDKILGGVCSGLAAYFDKEPLLFRLLAVALFLFFTLPSHGFGFWIPLAAYIVFWFVIPEARTVGERYQMRGEKNTLDSIMENVGKGAQEMGDAARKFNSEHPDILRTVMRAVSIMVGSMFIIASCAALLVLVLGLAGAAFALPVSLQTLTATLLGEGAALPATIAAVAAVGIPVVALLYLGIQMCFNFRQPRLHLGFIFFLLWIASVGTLAWFFSRAAFDYESGERQFAEVTVAPDSLGRAFEITLEGSERSYDYIYIDADEDSYELFMADGDTLFIYPEIKVRRDPDADGIRIRSGVINFDDKTREPDFCSYSDGTLVVEPRVVDGSGRLGDAEREITITLPDHAKLQVNSPRYHDFETRQHHTNIPMLR